MSEFDDDKHFSMDMDPDSLEVRELGTGRRVDRPDIAAIGQAIFSEAFEGAGGELHITRPEDLTRDAADTQAGAIELEDLPADPFL